MRTGEILSVRNLSYSHRRALADETWTLRIDELALRAGTMVVLSGDNMSGKSTLLKLLAGMIAADADPGGRDASIARRLPAARGCVFLSNVDPMFPELSVRDNLRLAYRGADKNEMARFLSASQAVMDRSGVLSPEVMHAKLGSLSSGGRAIVKLCRALDPDAELVLVDEVSSYLDDARAVFFLDCLLTLVSDGKCVVLVSHNRRDRDHLGERSETERLHLTREGMTSRLTSSEVP